MKTKSIKKIALFLAIISLFSVIFCCPFSASAAYVVDTRYPTKNITGYIISTSNRTAIAYSEINGSSIGYIYASDDCTIQAIYTNGWIKVKAPWTGYSNGRIVYTKLSYFLNTSYTPKKLKATVRSAAYSRKNLSNQLGYVYVNDTCYIVGESGNYYQVLCPWTGNVYRLCWVSKSAFGHTHSYSTGYEAAHPHKVYKKCSCGYYYYTGATKKISSCTTCYPHTHSYTTSYEAAHPHKVYKKCSCGYYYYTGATKKVSSCTTCYPSSATYTGYVNTSSSPLILRQSASSSSKSLASMPKGSQVTVLDNKAKTNGFYHVKYNGTTGYASASYITFTKPSNNTSNNVNTSSSVSLNVPYFAQNDSDWSSTYIGNKTIGNVGCLLTSISMAYSYKTGTTTNPETMKSKLRFNNNDFVWNSLSNIGFSYTSYNREINQAIYKDIYNHLKAGSPVIYGCGSTSGSKWHWVVITGYKGTSTTSFSASDFTINDPWANSTKKPTVGCRTNLQQYLNSKGTYCQYIAYYK